MTSEANDLGGIVHVIGPYFLGQCPPLRGDLKSNDFGRAGSLG